MKVLSPLRAIRKKCIDCCCDSTKSIKFCEIADCTLWPYRFGVRPSTAKRRYGKKALEPGAIPAADVALESISRKHLY